MKGLFKVASANKNAIASRMRMTSTIMGVAPSRSFRQVHDLHEVVYTSQAELDQRTVKYLERTDKVYKPS
jgi:hypothetical protein